MVLAGGGRVREERSGRIHRLCFGIAAATGRRPVALCLVRLRPTVRGATGETGSVTLTTDPTTSSAAATIVPPEPGHRADAVLRAAFRYRQHGLSRPDQTSGPSLVLAWWRSWGSSLRRFDPSAGWTRRATRRRRAARQRSHFRCILHDRDISVGPGPRAVRANRPPRLIFVGVTRPPVGCCDLQRRVSRG
jgi:hypothetical protein